MIDLVIIGGSTAFFEIIGIITDINAVNKRYDVVGILDDDEKLHHTNIMGIPVLGKISKAKEFKGQVKFVFGIGSMKTRLIRHEILSNTELDYGCFESIIHPNASIDNSAIIGPGCIIHPGVAIGNHATLDGFNIVAVNSAIGPFSRIHEQSMITSLCLVLSNATIGKNCFIGAMSCITENVRVEKGVFVGVGSIVTRSISEGSYGMGNPFRVLNVVDVSNIL
ncbi:MAG: hypothetical protein O2887_03770 [Bacteroidetes bacterium]|nr:hypothetical protein [Bacteroidota bacterium]MDA1119604.1 hypothetical protein [Bacteroidota bacterium]